MYLLKHYYIGDYDVKDFIDEYHRIYGVELCYSKLSEAENEYLEELYNISERFSQYEEDHELFPNFFFNEQDVRQKVAEVYFKLREGYESFE